MTLNDHKGSNLKTSSHTSSAVSSFATVMQACVDKYKNVIHHIHKRARSLNWELRNVGLLVACLPTKPLVDSSASLASSCIQTIFSHAVALFVDVSSDNINVTYLRRFEFNHLRRDCQEPGRVVLS